MPSKSKAQHNLMAMVANDPKAAKRLGIPQSVGEDYMKADKSRKFVAGGPTSYSGEDTGEGMKMSTRRGGSDGSDGMSFKQAFKSAKDGSVFEWNGKKYKKEYAEKKSSIPAPSEVKVTKTETSVKTSSDSSPRSGGRGSKPASAKVGSGRYDDPTSTYAQRVFSPLSKLTDIFGRRAEERVMRDMGVDRAEARKRLDALEDSKEGMRRGGSIKNGRPEMRESKGMMKKEVSFMKKKGAPKSMIKHEESEMKGKKMPKFAEGGRLSYADLQAKQAATKAREAAFRKANSVESRAAAQRAARSAPPAPRPAAPSGGAAMPVSGMGAAGGTQAMMRKGGMAGSYRKAADGKAHKGKTKGTMVKMREGGSVFRKAADGIASKGKTKGTMVKMAYGGKC